MIENSDDAPSNRSKPKDDEERVLLFEWHATLFRDTCQILPDLPSHYNMMKIPSAEVWHSLALRLNIARKFLIGNDGVRLDNVWKSIRNLALPLREVNQALIENLDWLIEDVWPARLDSGHQTIISDEMVPDGEEWLRNVLYGAEMHSDVTKTKHLVEWGPSLPFDMWTQWKSPGGVPISDLVVRTLNTIQEGRNDKTLHIGPPWKTVWPVRSVEHETEQNSNSEPDLNR